MIQRSISKPTVDLSIIIVHYKTMELTLQCIQSVYDFSPDKLYEVIVVDNGSDDGIQEQLIQRFPFVHFIQMQVNVGFSKANNEAIQKSRGHFILLLNSDCRLVDNLLKSMMSFMEKHEEVGVLGPRQVNGDGVFEPSCGRFPNLWREAVRKIIHYRLSINDYRLREYLDERHADRSCVDWVSGSCLLLRRQAVEESGLLDERFFMYFEDVDLCQRVKKCGWEVRYLPSQTLIHYGGQSAKLNIMRIMVENRKSQLYYGAIHYGALGGFLLKILIAIKYALNLVKWSMAYIAFKALNRKGLKACYARALVSKKILFLSIRHLDTSPKIPTLRSNAVSQRDIPNSAKKL